MTNSELLPLVNRSSGSIDGIAETLGGNDQPTPQNPAAQLSHQHLQFQVPTRRPVSLQLPISLSCFIMCTAASGYGAGLLHAAWWVQLLVWLSAVGSCGLLLAVNQADPGTVPCGTTIGIHNSALRKYVLSEPCMLMSVHCGASYVCMHACMHYSHAFPIVATPR